MKNRTPPERRNWNAWMHREWTGSRCIRLALSGAFRVVFGALAMFFGLGRPAGGSVVRAIFMIVCLFLIVYGILLIGLANRQWMRLRSVGRDAIHPLQ